MKKCNKSHKCQYGNAFQKGYCAYKENMEEYDICPILLDEWEDIINYVIKNTKERE